MDILTQHLRLAVRGLIRAPGFAVTAVVTLALGIGLSVAVFTVANALLLRRLPVTDQSRLVVLWGETRTGQFSNFPLPLEDVRDFARRARSLAGVAFFEFRGATPMPVHAGDRDWPLRNALVSGNFFDVLGSPAVLGRALRPEDDVAGAAPVLVLSHRAWQQYFRGDSSVVGRSITMLQSGRPYRIVGVMPQGLEYPRGAEAWTPLIAYGAAGGFLPTVSGELDMLARLRPGASPGQARSELTSYFARPDASHLYRDVRGVVHTLPDIVLGETKPAVRIIVLAAALLLLITCVNVTNLLLVRALGRVKELAVRSALGATRGRLIGQLLTESALLSVAGGVLGVGLAVGAVGMFVRLAPAGIPRLDEIGVNGTVLAAAVLITGAAMLVSALGPTLFSSRVNAQDALRAGSRQSGGRRTRVVAEALVVAQVALAAVSLSAAGSMARSFVKLTRVDLSFDPRRLLVADLVMRQDQVTAPEALTALEALQTRLEALPGVRAVSPVISAPFIGAGGGIDGRPSLPGQSEEEAAGNPMLNMETVAPNYFATLGIPVLRGRPFSDGDRAGSAPVVIVSASTARHFWPGEDAIGKRLQIPGGDASVIGVVPDTRYRELQTARPSIYFPLRQFSPVVPTTLLIRTGGTPEDVAPSVRRAVAEVHQGMAVAGAVPLHLLLDAPRAQPRLNALVLGTFAAIAVSLAAIGLFAVIATTVRQRTRELGIRMALGATGNDVRRMIVVRAIRVAAIGAVAGVAGTVATGRMLSSLLFEVSPTDAGTLAWVAAGMIGVALVASLVPARSSGRIDPIIALRSET